MARRRSHRSHRRSAPHAVTRYTRRRSGSLTAGGRFGVDLTDAGLAAMAGVVGGALQGMLQRVSANLPTLITQAPLPALGLYGVGVIFRRRDFRSIGAGMAIGTWAGVGVAAP